jgi:hypothetical protein
VASNCRWPDAHQFRSPLSRPQRTIPLISPLMTVVSLGVTAIHKCRSMSNAGRCLLWSALRTQVRRRARQRQRLTQNQWQAMQERAPLTAISLPTLDRLSDRYQAASSCRVCYASLRTPSRPLHPEPAPRSRLCLACCCAFGPFGHHTLALIERPRGTRLCRILAKS